MTMDLSKYSAEMEVTRGWVFLDCACVAPISNRARDAMVKLAQEMARDGPANEKFWVKVYRETRKLAAQMLHCDSKEIAFVKNTSEGISFVANGFPFEAGDNVVTTNIEFPANRYVWFELERKGVTVTAVADENGRVPTDSLLGAVTENTRLISVSSVQFRSGFRHDLKSIGDFCRERDIFFCVDIIQSMGALETDVKECGISAASADGHKWLVSPEGIGVLYISKEAQKVIRPTEIGWFNFVNPLDFITYDNTLKDDATKYESGSLNTLGVFALNESMKLLLEIGVKNIERHIIDLSDYLCERLIEKGYRIYSSRLPGEKSQIVVFDSSSVKAEEINDALKKERIVVTCRGGRIRAAIHFFNTREEIDKVVNVLPEVGQGSPE